MLGIGEVGGVVVVILYNENMPPGWAGLTEVIALCDCGQRRCRWLKEGMLCVYK